MGKNRNARKYRAERIAKWRNANVIGRNITRLRNIRGLEMDDMAREMGVNCATLWKWENGVNIPSFYDALYVAECFGVEVDSLLKLKK